MGQRWQSARRADCWSDRCPGAAATRRGSSETELSPSGRASGRAFLGDPAMSPLARRTNARPVGSGGGRGAVGRNVGTFLQRARSGRVCSARASAGDRAVAAQGGSALLCSFGWFAVVSASTCSLNPPSPAHPLPWGATLQLPVSFGRSASASDTHPCLWNGQAYGHRIGGTAPARGRRGSLRCYDDQLRSFVTPMGREMYYRH